MRVILQDGPIAYCSELYQEFTNLAESEHELYSFYTELAYQVEEYACSLLDKVIITCKLTVLKNLPKTFLYLKTIR